MMRRIHWLSLGLALTAAISLAARQAPVSDTVQNPLADDPAAAAAGDRLYAAACQVCHGPAGEGDAGRGGPPLNTTALTHGNGDGELFHAIRAGIPGTPMAPFAALTDQQIWQIVSYLRRLQSAGTAVAAPAGTRASAETIAAGEALFFGRAACSTCHEVSGRGGITGPDLSAAGRLPADVLRRKIVAPNDAPPAAAGGGRGRGGATAAPPLTIVARTRDGGEIRGVRRNEDTFSLQMVDADGRLHLLDKMALASVAAEPRSLMPDDYAMRLSAGEIDSLVAYLNTQQGRDLARTAAAALPAGGLTDARLRAAKAEPHNWLMYWGDYQGTHYSPLDAITPDNVANLRPAWTFPILGGGSVVQGTPIVVDGVMYVTGSGNPTTVAALDARTGRQIWRWSREQATVNPYQINPVSRGVAMLGHRLFVGTLDAVLISLDARTGRPLWEVQVADTMEGYTITSPPLVVGDKVITGIAGGEYATRGFIDAYDADTGRRLWRFHTVPGPGEFGNDTWQGDSWRTGGGATWLTGSYDPDLNLVYWAVGNPAAQIDRSVRGDLDNLFTDAVVALDADTGALKWHYQFTPNDGHDWDSVQDLVLVDRNWRGEPRKLLLHADRNGHFYVLDRTSGEFLAATPFVYQNWNAGFDERGRPQPLPGSNSSPEGSYLVYPRLSGGTNFQAPSYSPRTGWFYLSFAEGGQQFVSAPAPVERGRQYIGRGVAPGGPPAPRPGEPEPNSGIKALDPDTGRTVWAFPTFQGSNSNGVLATGGNVLFASIRDGNLVALDAATGAPLWHFQTGGNHAASPMSYAVDGRQYVAMSAGNVVFSFALPDAASRAR